MRILVIEDELALQSHLKQQLSNNGFAVDVASDGEEGLFLAKEYPFDLAIIDLGLPKLSGIDVIKQMRTAKVTTPVLILTARDNWQDKVEGLEAGADDYLTKPFHIEECLARVNALMRRASGWAQSILVCGSMQLDTSAQVVTVDERAIELTAYEYRLLEYLVLHAGEVISKTVLTEHIYDQDFDRDSNVIEVFVGRLRKKLDPSNQLKPIETLRGRGYRFNLARDSA